MLKVNTKELREAVRRAKAVIRPGLLLMDTCIRFTAKKGKLMLLTNSSGVRSLNCIVCKCGDNVIDFIVNVDLLSGILPFFQSEEITLTLDKKKSLVILEGGTLRLTLATITTTVWANAKRSKEWETELKISSEELKIFINRTSYAAFTKDTTDIRSTLKIATTGNGICVTCLDGYRIALCGDIKGEEDTSFTLPVYLLKIMSAFLDGPVYLRKRQDQYEIGDRHMIVWGKTPSAGFYNISQLLSQRPSDCIRLPKDEFLRLVETAALVNRTRILFTVKNGTIKVSAKGDGGDVENTLEAETKVNASYCINPIYLVDALKKCPDEDVFVYYSKTNITPLFLESCDHQDIILPIQQ